MPGSYVSLRILVPLASFNEVYRRGGEAHGQTKIDSKNPEHGDGLVEDSAHNLQHLEGLAQLDQSK